MKMEFDNDKLRELMKRTHETSYRLAKSIGVECATVTRWVSGKTQPSLANIGKLSAHYGVQDEEFERK